MNKAYLGGKHFFCHREFHADHIENMLIYLIFFSPVTPTTLKAVIAMVPEKVFD